MSYSWPTAFGADYDVPETEIFAAGLTDQSWHNDACPSFGIPEGMTDPTTNDIHDLRLWVEHPNPDDRQTGGPHRFVVNYLPWSNDAAADLPRADEGDDVYGGDDLDAALAAFAEARKKIVDALANTGA